ncbi:PREDICTED: PRA1 family protein H [Fragaria vesca subsp. vesca]|uniref:PRA1 family protein H n=1 Tax=Fragaria vesca subsp. vesca TaxID=101020 RepID=UPI0002C374F0|nr:PREDICTED: PRA1 family protein H [Fragaria vesca subsp. vesca]
MVFSANPLSLSVSDPFFDSWLRQNGYPEILEHRPTSSATSAATTSAATPSTSSSTSTVNGFFTSLYSTICILLSLFSTNPFAKLTNDDLAAPTPPWQAAFIGDYESYSFPVSGAQAQLRVQENVKRYARNYAWLLVIFFACSLYQMPWAAAGLIFSLALWEIFKHCSAMWGLDQYPTIQQTIIRVAQCVAAVILIYSGVQMALFSALSVNYAGMILHAGFRTLTRAKQASHGRSR